jgi:subtilisin family serine protease
MAKRKKSAERSSRSPRSPKVRHLGVNQSLDRLIAYVSVRSIGKISLFSGRAQLKYDTIQEFTSTDKDTHIACGKLQEMGFEIEWVGPLTIRVAGPAKLYTKHMGVKFEQRTPETMMAGVPATTLATATAGVATPGGVGGWPGLPRYEPCQYLGFPYGPTMATAAKLLDGTIDEVEGIAFPEPIVLHAPAARPPSPAYHHFKPPADLVKWLNASPVHQQGFQGQNVRAAMIDSGFQWSHPYYKAKKYNVKVSLPEDSDADANGHGTGESANLLALAPRVRLHGLSMDDTVHAFQVARDTLKVQIISNSWGTLLDTDGPNGYWHPYWSLVQAEIALCARQGIAVVFSGGNGAGMSFTASMPETISIGGIYIDKSKNKMASNYASSFRSTRFPGQKVPFVCGLVGQQPKAIYITLPIPPGCEIDKSLGGSSFPNRDETTKVDGWGVFSGTSAACPQIAGVIALILSKHPGANLTEIRHRLSSTAVDITAGQSYMGDPAGPGVDDATGYGLVNAEKACS